VGIGYSSSTYVWLTAVPGPDCRFTQAAAADAALNGAPTQKLNDWLAMPGTLAIRSGDADQAAV